MNKLPLPFGLGSDLQKHRRARRMTQEVLAENAGLSIPTVRLLERTHGNLTSWHVVLRALGRLRFGANGKNQSAPFPSALVIWGADIAMVEKLDAAFPEAWKTGIMMRPHG